MKTNKKIFVAVIALVIAVSVLAFAACDPEKVDNSVDNALALEAKCDTTSVRLTKGETVYYSFEKSGDADAVISDPYGTGVTADGFVDFAKEIKSAVTSSDVTVTEKYYSESSGAIKLTATFNDAAKLLGVEATDAKIEIDGNLITNKVNSYKVTYVDESGYTVEIALK